MTAAELRARLAPKLPMQVLDDSVVDTVLKWVTENGHRNMREALLELKAWRALKGDLVSDRTKAFIVVLDHDLGEEATAATIEALKHFRGVIDVKLHVNDIADVIAESRAFYRVTGKIYEALQNLKP